MTRAAGLCALALAAATQPGCVVINADYVLPAQGEGAEETDGGGDSDGGTFGGTGGQTSALTGVDETTTADDATTGVDEPAPVCGDGVVEGDEECDAGEDNGAEGVCTDACLENVCGDGMVGPGESCDDGDLVDGDGCSQDCVLESCGNGLVENGEECDDGDLDNTDDCTTSCTAAACGDGFAQEGEECDDGNGDNSDACTVACAAAACGDGYQQGGEECDDGDDDNLDTCTDVCALAACGDGYKQGPEECDDGDDDNNDECTQLCMPPICGDGFVLAGSLEECDDGDEDNVNACTNLCNHAPVGITHSAVADTAKAGAEDSTEFQLCEDGFALVGVELKGAEIALLGTMITQIKAFCAEIQLEPDAQQWVITTGTPTQQGPTVGYNGPDPFAAFCEPGYVVTGFAGRRANGLFKRLQLRCTSMFPVEEADGFSVAFFEELETPNVGYGGEQISFGPHDCPGARAATGVAVGLGDSGLGSIKLRCHQLDVI